MATPSQAHSSHVEKANAYRFTDGQRVVVYFGSCGLRAYSFEGRELWHLPLPVPRQVGDFGSCTSPVLADDRVLLNRDQLGGSELIAVDARQGTVLWRAARPEFLSSYSTPVAADGRIYLASLKGVVTVLAAGDVFRVLAQTDFKDRLAATPALAENRLYLRTDKHLYALGEP